MPQAVWSSPVTSPASIPASTEQAMASPMGAPLMVSRTHTAAPVPRDPSTVRSATSRIL